MHFIKGISKFTGKEKLDKLILPGFGLKILVKLFCVGCIRCILSKCKTGHYN